MHKPSFVFFGTPDIAVASLDALFASGRIPTLIITAPDKPQGRGLVPAPSPVKTWARAHEIPVQEPKTLSDPSLIAELKKTDWDVFVLVAYGKIIPQTILDIPKRGTLNMHPSVLPKHRGPSPIESQILNEQDASAVGVSVMLLDAEMDHGPILSQTDNLPALQNHWPVGARELRVELARAGGALLAETISRYLAGVILPKEQDHNSATYCKKISKEDALIDLAGDAQENYRKILAYETWPRAYFITERNGKPIRVIIAEARYENNALVIERVIPEGKKEMPYAAFLSGNH